jgi:hypothetical protein
MKPNDTQAQEEFLRWVKWSYNQEVAQECAERLRGLSDPAAEVDPHQFAWDCYCHRYADSIETVERMQDVPFHSALTLDMDDADQGAADRR